MERESTIWDRVTAISSALLVLTALGALLLAYNQIQEARDEACIGHLQDMVRQLNEPPISGTLRSLASQRIDQSQKTLRPLDPTNAPSEMYEMLNYFETMALLANRGYLNEKDVRDQFGWWFFHFYADARPVIEFEQKDNPETYEKLSRLMSDLEQIEKQSGGGKLNHPSADDLYNFYDAEATAPEGEGLQSGARKKIKK